MSPTDPLLDPSRRAALHAAGVLDTPPERAFDRLVAVAAALLRAPIAVVSFVDDDRQFFKSSMGLPEPWASARQTPLSHSFCQHVVRTGAPLVVGDARTHPLVCDNLAVCDIGYVAYAGVPLTTATGHVLGSLCAVDVVARAWTEGDVAHLVDLAESVMTELALRAEVAERRRAEAALRASEARYRGLLERLPDIVYENSPEPPYAPRYVSPALAGLGYAEAAWREHPDFWTSILHEDDRERVLRDTRAARATATLVDHEFRVRAADGTVRWLHDRGEIVVAGGSGDDAVVWQGVMVDITERKTLEAELLRQASEDGLTGLANRTRLRARAHRALAAASANASPAVLLIDLDDFKRVNDSLGHAAGDALLEMVATRLLGATRGSDTVARLGGDEFAVLLASVRGATDVTPVADRIVAALATPFVVDGREIRIGASVGVAVAVAGDSANDLLRNADLALYRAKGMGKGRHAAFAPEMHAAAVTRLELEAELRHAIEHAELVVHYQPILDLATGAVLGAEALVRWDHPTRGLVPPGEFIPLAESTDLVVPLGRCVLRTACADAAGWRTAVGDAVPPSVSVNVSGRQLQRPGFVEDVAEALSASGLAARRLVLEVTESVLLADLETALKRLDALRALGVRIALDDFGTGYSSLAYLQRLPVHILKIDRAFTGDVTAGGKRAAIVRAVIALADTLGLRTVAEGVETAAQHAQLRALGCGLGQGYLYARPMPAAAFTGYLATPRALPGAAAAPEAAEAPPVDAPAPDDGRPVGRATGGPRAGTPGTVLVVEDEPGVRETVRRVLAGAGYAVLEAADGAEALRALAAHPSAVDLVVADVVMPELSGRSLADALAAAVPDKRVILMSGYDTAHIVGQGLRAPEGPVLEKPFTADALLAAVRGALVPALA